MEMQLFILGHMILYGICVVAVVSPLVAEGCSPVEPPGYALLYFIPLEIIYWVLHWLLV